MKENVVIIGAGGHAKVIADILSKSNDVLIGFLDDNVPVKTVVIGEYKVIGKVEEALKIIRENSNVKFIIGIGNNKIRKKIAEKYNLPYYTAIHPSANIGIETKIAEGTVIMANACINANATIGKHCIINTGSIVEHDNKIEDFVHISPNASLGGTVEVGVSTHIGIGASVKNNIKICDECTIGAGAVIVKDIEESGTYVGVPGRKKGEKNEEYMDA